MVVTEDVVYLFIYFIIKQKHCQVRTDWNSSTLLIDRVYNQTQYGQGWTGPLIYFVSQKIYILTTESVCNNRLY